MKDQRYVLILGATSDMARATAYEYARNGFNLHLAARDKAALEADVHDLQVRYDVQVQAHELDVLAFGAHQSFWEELEPKPEGVLCFIGYLGKQELAQQDWQEARMILDTNYTGPVSLLNLAASAFEQQGRGFIVGVSSVAGERGRQSNYFYGSAKAGFSAYLSGLRNRLSRSNVSVLTVKPGYVDTKMTEGMDLPAPITAQPQEVAKAIYQAQQKGKNSIYVKWMWRPIMAAIRNIPEPLFKKMKL